MFTLDEKLKKDTIFVKSLKVCDLLLMNNSDFFWLILVPRKSDLVELIDLDFDEQVQVLKEINLVAKFLKNDLNPDKINIAMLGNVVKQLHIHIIARFKNDKAFPKPAFGFDGQEYQEKELQKIIQKIQNEIT
jgi:diadenosine tetraphosphate (Ap4A) HIT family hydrolase